jgi:hypothetical protein
MNPDVLPAQEGDLLTIKMEVKAAPACEHNHGMWYCETHQELFANNFSKSVHVDKRGRHLMAWFCLEHGTYEAPGPQKEEK